MAAIERRWSTRAVPRIAVGPLAVADVAALLADALGAQSPDAVADLAALLHQRTSGNAQMLRELLTSPSTRRRFPGTAPATGSPGDLPASPPRPVLEGVAALLTSRLARLPEVARRAR
ncbi:MAG: hypothetical protein IPN17_35035 [Deltaproteobacteria bacterium]|nr:hypothetical protein [Deltaproteobacteria bacterium]